MRKTILGILVGIYLASFATGCSPAENPTGTSLPSTKLPELTATLPAPSRRTVPEGAIEYTRTGGIAGIADRWRLFVDGRVIDAQGVEYAIPEAQMANLFAEIEVLGFYDWEASTRRLDSCADCFTYTISANHDGQINQLSFVDGQADVPEGIWTILNRIQAILNTIVENQAN